MSWLQITVRCFYVNRSRASAHTTVVVVQYLNRKCRWCRLMISFQWPCSKLQDVDGHKCHCQQRHQHCNWCSLSVTSAINCWKCLSLSHMPVQGRVRHSSSLFRHWQTVRPYSQVTLTVWCFRSLTSQTVVLSMCFKVSQIFGQLDFNVVLGSHKCGEIISVMSHLSRRTVSRHLCTGSLSCNQRQR